MKQEFYSMKQANVYLLIPVFLLLVFNSKAQQLPVTGKNQNGSKAMNNIASDNISDNWYNDAVANLQKLAYDFFPSGNRGSFKLINSKNHIACTVDYNNYTVCNTLQSQNEKPWSVKFVMKGFGRGSSIQSFDQNYTVEKGNAAVVYKTKDAAVEYINNEKGLRQNFLINTRPSGKGLLKISLNVNSNLIPVLVHNKLSFFDQGNPSSERLSYTDLNVWDADHKILPARMAYNEQTSELSLLIDDTKSTYPIVVDPINQTPEWTTSADGLLSGLISSTELNTALYGYTVASIGDVNGDGFNDAAVSAPGLADIFSGSGTLAGVGAVFVYYGSFTGLSATPNNILQPNTAVAGALFGFSIDAGDVTGDGKNDIIIGAPLDKYTVHVQTALLGGAPLGTGPLYADVTVSAGKAYIYKSEDLPSAPNPASFLQIKLGNGFFSPGILGIIGNNINVKSLFGFSVAATDDMNNDGKADVVIGCPSYLGTGLLDIQSGAAFVYYSNNLSTSTPVQLQVPSLSLLGLAQLPVLNSSGLLFGYSVDGVGDYNNDGQPDLVVGAPAGIDLSSLGGVLSGQFLGGSAYVYYGNGSGINSSIGARLQASASGLLGNAANLFGYKVKGMKNVNGLHNGKIAVGAPVGGLIPNALSLTIQTGNVQVFQKKASSPAGVVTADQVIESPKSTSLLQLLGTLNLNVLFGASLDNAYDVNCDSYPDLVVGEPLSSGTNISQLQVNAVGGSAYIFYGTANGLFNATPVYTASATYGSEFLSVNATALFGFSVAGLPKLMGPTTAPRILVGSPSGALDFSSSLLNLGNTLKVLFNFTAGNNGLGKAYTFNPSLCGSFHTLPAEPLDLKGHKEQTSVQLNWATTNENEISAYIVEKSPDGISFSTMAYVFAKGNDDHNNYSMIDNHPAKMNYYRVRAIHKDNSFVYSSIVKIKFDDQSSGNISIAPNPVISDYRIKLTGLESGVYTMEIKNSSGQLIQRRNISLTGYEYTETMTRLTSMITGIYYLNIYDQTNKQVKTIKLLAK